MVVRGEPGIGKTALLDYAAGRALGFRVIWARGVESEMELAFAGLHELCAPMLRSQPRRFKNKLSLDPWIGSVR
jgi:hypothetical protein